MCPDTKNHNMASLVPCAAPAAGGGQVHVLDIIIVYTWHSSSLFCWWLVLKAIMRMDTVYYTTLVLCYLPNFSEHIFNLACKATEKASQKGRSSPFSYSTRC